MISVYPECYLATAKDHLAVCFDFAINGCGIDGCQFVNAFVQSSFARAYERGSAWALAGVSGEEAARMILEERLGGLPDAQRGQGGGFPDVFDGAASLDGEHAVHVGCEYWIGWSAAHFQWETGLSFRTLFEALPYEALMRWYPTYHQVDVVLFVEDARAAVARAAAVSDKACGSRLARIREAAGYSQSNLAHAANVSLRSIQMYEQGRNDINKAQAATLFRLARVLGCHMEDLLETPWSERYEYSVISLDDKGADDKGTGRLS